MDDNEIRNAVFMAAALYGCGASKTYYDPIKGQNVVEIVAAKDLFSEEYLHPKCPKKADVEEYRRGQDGQ